MMRLGYRSGRDSSQLTFFSRPVCNQENGRNSPGLTLPYTPFRIPMLIRWFAGAATLYVHIYLLRIFVKIDVRLCISYTLYLSNLNIRSQFDVG